MANGNTASLVGLQDQLNTVRSEVFTINSGLQNIAGLIQTDSFLDQQKLRDEREQQRLLNEREIRLGQEEQLQQRVSASLVQPVVKLENKITPIFERITSVLKYLFVGFLGKNILGILNAGATKSVQAITSIGSVVRNAFGFIGSGFALLKSGFSSIINGVQSITSKIGNTAIKLVSSPFKAISDIFKNLFKVGGTGGGAAAGAAATTAESGLLKILQTVGKVGGTALGAVATAQNIKEGDVAGAALSGAATIPNPFQMPAIIGSVAYELSTGGGIDFGKMLSSGKEATQKFNFNINQFNPMNIDFSQMGKNLFGTETTNLDAPAKEVKGKVETPKTTSTKPVKLESIPQQSIKQQPNIGALPEPAPDIVYLQNSQKNNTSVASGGTQTLTDVPLIPSSNPDNFYALYAQVSYNVVM
jgi:hypothetical protein